MPSTAWAYWSSEGSGTGTATVATLPPIVVSAVAPLYSDTVEVSWQEPAVPAGMAITGYRVVRVAAGTPVPACGATSSVALPPTTLSCVDADLPDGAADYVVTAVVGTWTTAGTTDAPATVTADRTAPTIRLTGAERSNALVDRRDGESLLFFRPGAGGTVRIDAELTDEETGPASATFPAITAAGWSHASETVTVGTGSAPTVTYRSAAVTFAPDAATPEAIAVTGVDERGNVRTRQLAFVADAVPPAGGALTVNDVAADTHAPQSWDTDGAFTVSTITPFSEVESASESGLADVVLTRESAALSDGTCSSFGGASTLALTAPVQETGLPDGCYRYSLTGTDHVGNAATIATIVRVDTTAPAGGALQANGVDAVPSGSVSVTASGSWSVTRSDFADVGSGILSSTLTRAQGALNAGSCESFGPASTIAGSPGEASATTGCYRYLLTGMNTAGLTSELSTTVWVDGVAPAGGSMTVNGAAATGAGSSSTSTSDGITIAAVTGFTDANAGIDSNVITRTFAPMVAGVCGEFDGASEPVSGTAPFSVTGLMDGCHRFTLTGTDLVGNSAAISTTVRLDASAPSSGSIMINGVSGTVAEAQAGSSASSWNVVWTKFTDAESIMATSTLVRTQNTLTGGVCSGAWLSPVAVTITGASGTAAQTGMTAGRCYRYVLTGTNALNLTSTLAVIVRYDSSAPSGGVLAVNGRTLTTATAVTSTSITGTFSVAVSTLFSDTISGMESNVLARSVASVAGNVCGVFGTPVVTTLTTTYSATESGLAPGCYQYVLTGTNGSGGLATRTTTVRVDTTRPVGALTVNGVDAASSPTSSQAIAAYPIARTDFTDPETSMTSSTLVRTSAALTGGVCGTSYGGATTLTGTPTQTGLPSACYRYVLTGTNSLNLSTAVSTIVAYDPSPSGGAFTVNGTAGSAAGSSSTIAAGGSFSVTAFAGYTEAQSVLVSSTFTRTPGVAIAGVCGSFDSASTVTLPSSTQTQNGLPNGCYRYVLTGVNSFGGTASVSSTVRVGP